MYKYILSLSLLLFALAPSFAAPQKVTIPLDNLNTTITIPKTQQISKTIQVKPLNVVASPDSYLAKKIIMDGKFDKFTTLGLDYKRAFRDSQQYIGFLIQRDDVKDHNVPLSELKMFIKRDYAEKFIDMNTGDKISITGKVFSSALGDAWVDVEAIEILEKAPVTKKQ